MKIVKRMEGFRVRHVSDTRERRLLLPLSTESVSSIALLHVLNEHLRVQKERTGRTGYYIHVLLLFCNDIKTENEQINQRFNDKLKSRYHDHQISVVLLDDILRTNSFDDRVKRFAINLYLKEKLSRTTYTDLRLLLVRLATVDFARKVGSECILWPHSTTELARLILSETAKGNGAFVGQLIADGSSPYHALSFHYPMRELLDKEVEVFIDMLFPGEDFINIKKSRQEGIKNAADITIDKVMHDYCNNTEKSYPNIVANVVRTCGKLEAAAADSTQSMRCMLCTALTRTVSYEYSHISSDPPNSGSSSDPVNLCSGCARIMSDATGNIQPISR